MSAAPMLWPDSCNPSRSPARPRHHPSTIPGLRRHHHLAHFPFSSRFPVFFLSAKVSLFRRFLSGYSFLFQNITCYFQYHNHYSSIATTAIAIVFILLIDGGNDGVKAIFLHVHQSPFRWRTLQEVEVAPEGCTLCKER